MQIYADARTVLQLASEKFDEVEKRRPALEVLEKQIATSTEKLNQQTSQRDELNTQITDIQEFLLQQNPLPSDRNARQVKLTGFLTELKAYEQQLKGKIKSQSEYKKKIKQINATCNAYSKNLEKLQEEESKLTETRN